MKKLLLAAVAASVAATGFAGTASYAAPTAQPASFAPSAYIEGALGWARTDIGNYIQGGKTGMSHENGGFAGGIDAGYNFMPHLGVEAGFLMPFQKTETADKGAKFSSYDFYGAAKLSANVAPKFNVFALAGLGYSHIKLSAPVSNGVITIPKMSDSAFGFVGGVGANYMVANNITVGVKYLDMPGRNKTSIKSLTDVKLPFPGPQYFLATVGFQFG